MRTSFQIAATAAVLATASFGPATAANATIYNVTGAGVFNFSGVNMSGTIAGFGAFNANETVGPIVLTGTTDAGAAFTVITYCFDILQGISVGFGSQATVNYTFSTSAITNDQSGAGATGNALSASQVERMSGLANLGAWLYTSGASNLTARMAAIQSAIWSVEYGLTATNFTAPGAQAYYTSYMARSFAGASTTALVSSNAQGQLLGNVQGLTIGTVPEPASWALMIIGFGMVGVSTRHSRRNRAVAA